MKVVWDLCAGAHGWISGIPDLENWEVYSIDNNPTFNCTITGDLRRWSYMKLIHSGWPHPDLILFSPPCTTFSIASCSTHWTPPPDRRPKTDAAVRGNQIVESGIAIILDALKYGPTEPAWILENPRGLLRKMPYMERYNDLRVTVWYCQYGDERAKPTDLWGEFPTYWAPRPQCKNGNPNCDHERAPRGAKTGTQGRKGNTARALVPEGLSRSVFEAMNVELER